MADIRDNQSGMASILIALISMLVISLIVLGFAQVSQREQRETLDRVLSTQALYAAESGVNAVQNAIETNINDGQSVPDKRTCSSGPNYSINQTIDASAHIYITCLLVNPAPSNLIFTPITGQGKVLELKPASGQQFNDMVISWQNSTAVKTGGFTCNSTYPQLAQATSWSCKAGVLRVDIVPFDDFDNEYTTFLYPSTGAQNGYGQTTYSTAAANEGNITNGVCNSTDNALSMPDMCNVEIHGLNSSADGGYYLRILSIYGDQNVTISAPAAGSTSITCSTTGGTCNYDNLINDQVLVDSTGQAQDVLKRLQARVSINPLDQNVFPDDAIQSNMSICKQFYVMGDGSVQSTPQCSSDYP